jgi:uncharacterized DUF497 family protein
LNVIKINLIKNTVLPSSKPKPFSTITITINDPDHPDDECCYIDIGFFSEGRVLVVWYTERNKNIRIIGSRKAIRTGRKAYEEKGGYF